MLSICSSCKKIRDDKGYWNKVEQYISQHTDASFTHGICPDCAEKFYPGFVKKQSNSQPVLLRPESIRDVGGLTSECNSELVAFT
ncbi:MAG: hypothetical protein Q8K98_13795 [Bacteroidota bacterium]|nr:hypothetical protein [Bacteroidota bacterium]